LVVFDPTYSPVTCGAYFSRLNAAQYLDLSISDWQLCPVWRIFFNRNGYIPVRGYEANVANDHGYVMVRQSGECGFIPDTGANWDFQVPCKAHDYCYDLRKAGFSGTVTDSSCDSTFNSLMSANCNDRNIVSRTFCYAQADIISAAVGPAVTNPDPAEVSLKVKHSLKCLDVRNFSTLNDAPVDQYTCTGTSNQRVKFVPEPSQPGLFKMVMSGSGKCIDVNVSNAKIAQWACNPYTQQFWQIDGTYNQDIYIFKSSYNGFNRCIDVPSSILNNSTSYTPAGQLIEYNCAQTDNQRWYITA
jgi:hypothetical protein